MTAFNRIKSSAVRRNIPFDISIRFLWELFLQQHQNCSLTGEPLKFDVRVKHQTASLDRIDSSKGYIVGNVQWVHKDINNMKQSLSQAQFIEWCKKVVNGNA